MEVFGLAGPGPGHLGDGMSDWVLKPCVRRCLAQHTVSRASQGLGMRWRHAAWKHPKSVTESHLFVQVHRLLWGQRRFRIQGGVVERDWYAEHAFLT